MTDPRTDLARRRPLPAAAALALLWMLFAAVRLLTAWFLRDEVNGDLAIVELMARDMVGHWQIPAFFYGQAYMGSLEPVANALSHLLFGRTHVGLAMGTALFFFLMAWSVTRAARRAGGAWAAVAALALCVVGPPAFAHYAVSPRGGYGVLLFTTAGLLDFGALLICDARHAGRCRASVAGCVGLLAGIGFWCDQLVFPAAAAVALCVFALAPRLLARPRFWGAALAGFAVGSAPFWVWNARHGWESFQMAGGLVADPVVAARNLLLLATDRWPALLGVNPPYASRPWAALIGAVSLLLPALAFRAFAPLPRRIHPDERPLPSGSRIQLLLCLVFLLLFLACFLCSHFAVFPTPRYLLPAVPALAILAGAACTSPRFRSANLLAVALLALLVGWQVRQFPLLAARGRQDAARMADYREAAAYLEARGVDAAYCAFRHNALNLCGSGAIAFSDSNLERVPAFRFQAEASASPAVVDDFLGIARWATASGGSLCATNIGGLRLATAITPPPAAVEEVSPVSGSETAEPVPAVLFDRNFATALEMEGGEFSIDIPLDGPRRICGVRALVSGLDGKASLQVFGRTAPDAPMEPLARAVPNVPCRWSGPRFYPDPDCPVLESHFPTCEVDAVRLVFRSAATGGPLRKVREVQLLGPPASSGGADAGGPAAQLAPALVAALRRQGVRRLYAGRWAANAVSIETRGAIWTNCGQDLHPKRAGCPAPRVRPAPVELDGTTALFVSPSGEPALRDVLRKTGIAMRRLPVEGLGVLFVPETVQEVPFGPGMPSGIVFDEHLPSFLPSAEWVAARLAAFPDDDAPRSIPPTLPALRALMALSLPDGIAAEVRAALDRLVTPTMGGEAVFNGTWKWHGARVLSSEDAARPGGTVRIRHYWSCPRGSPPPPVALSVFIRFDGPGGCRLHDGHLLEIPPEGLDDADADEAFWHVDREVALPPDAPPGLYEMRLGLCDAIYSSRRLSVDTRLPHRRNAVIVGTAFAVGSQNQQD